MNQSTINTAKSAGIAALVVLLLSAIAQRFGVTISPTESTAAAGLLTVVIHHYIPWVDDTTGAT